VELHAATIQQHISRAEVREEKYDSNGYITAYFTNYNMSPLSSATNLSFTTNLCNNIYDSKEDGSTTTASTDTRLGLAGIIFKRQWTWWPENSKSFPFISSPPTKIPSLHTKTI
jgi:hypothetical protein